MEISSIIKRFASALIPYAELLLTVFGLIIGLLAFFFSKRVKNAKFAVLLIGVLCIPLIAVCVWERSTVEIPNVVGLDRNTAMMRLREMGLQENCIAEKDSILQDNPTVTYQNPSASSIDRYHYGTVVQLCFGENSQDYLIRLDDTEGLEPLTLSIVQSNFFADGYHYEFPDPKDANSTVIIDFSRGISGTFSYSRALAETEKEKWGHGGTLYDSNGNIVDADGDYPTFWSDPDGLFAVEFPQNLDPGTYTYELYQVINGQYVSDTQTFSID